MTLLPSFSVHRYLIGLLLLPAVLAFTAHAQPSGGPYGPINQNYEIPKANNIYFVAPNGSASAAGTALNAPTTLESAIARVVSGDAIILRGGVYRTGSMVLNQGIALQPYADEKPILKGTEIATDWEAVGDNVWRTSWAQLFPSKPMAWWRQARNIDRTPLHRFNNDMVFIDGKYLQSAGSVDELSANTYYINYQQQAVYIGADPAGHTVEITTHDTALTRTTSEIHGKTADKIGPKIRGIMFTQYAWTALAIEGKRHFTHLEEPVDEPIGIADPSTYGKEVIGTLLDNVTISFVGRVAGYFRGDGLVIRNSLISDTGTEGIYVIGSSDVLLERNIIRRNDIERITGYYVSAVKIINQTHNVLIRDNLILDHPSSKGVWYDVGNRNGVFINNYVEGTDTGFFFEISRGVTVAGNVFVNNRQGSWILNSADAHIYNNTYVNSMADFKRDKRSAQGDHFDWHPATGPGVEEREGHIFMNNLLVATDAGFGPLLRVEQPQDLCEKLNKPALSTLNGNTYIRPSTPYKAAEKPLLSWADPNAEGCVTNVTSLTAFQEKVPAFELQGQQLDGDTHSTFVAPDIRRFKLLQNIPTSKQVSMPAEVRKHLGWSKKEAATTVGAYPAK